MTNHSDKPTIQMQPNVREVRCVHGCSVQMMKYAVLDSGHVTYRLSGECEHHIYFAEVSEEA